MKVKEWDNKWQEEVSDGGKYKLKLNVHHSCSKQAKRMRDTGGKSVY